MDVTCERCGTEYEFDETLVSDRGTTVKCTNCGHLFKVFRPDAGGGARSWQVESTDGTVRTLGSLKELQQLISQRVLSPYDRISRGGGEWKLLGDIAELATFFEAAAAPQLAGPAPYSEHSDLGARATIPGKSVVRSPSSRPRSRTLGGTGAPAAPTSAPPPRRGKSTMMGVGPRPEAEGTEHREPAAATTPEPSSRPAPPSPTASPAKPASVPPPAAPTPAPSTPAPVLTNAAVPPRRAAPPPRPAPSSRPPPPAPASEAEATVPARPTAGSTPSSRPDPIDADTRPTEPARPANRPLYLDDQEPVVPTRGKSRGGWWVALVIVLAAAVGVALGWPQLAPLVGLGTPADPTAPHVGAADVALALDTVSGYDRAVHHYTQALALDERSARVLTGLSRAHALWAQALLFDAADLEARADEDRARSGEAAAVRREAQRHAETALRRAEDAVRYGAGNADAEIALADALRLTGDATRARSRLDRALTLRSTPSGESLRVAALLVAAAAEGDLGAARVEAEEAVAEEPGLIRARLLLTRALLAARDVGAARQQVEAVLRRDGQHPRASALRDAIEQGRPPAPPTVDVPPAADGGTEPSAASPSEPARPEPGTPAAREPAAAPSITPAGSEPSRRRQDDDGPVPSGRDYSWYIRQGDERLDRGDVQRAAAFYEAARGVRPSGSEALTGLGHVALERGDAAGAAAKFRQATSMGYAEAYIGLGQAYRRAGRTQDAITAYQGYLNRLPSGPRAAQARRQIDELRAQLAPAEPAPAPVPAAPTEPAPAPDPDPAPAPPPAETDPGALPGPRGATSPPPQDIPTVESDPNED
jgi:predicted Zn finger-like uncharacterized protein